MENAQQATVPTKLIERYIIQQLELSLLLNNLEITEKKIDQLSSYLYEYFDGKESQEIKTSYGTIKVLVENNEVQDIDIITPMAEIMEQYERENFM